MTRISTRFALICAIALLASASASGDEIQRGASPPFGSMSAGVFDKVNNANLNVHFAIPVLVKAGRGLPLGYLQGRDLLRKRDVPSGGKAALERRLFPLA